MPVTHEDLVFIRDAMSAVVNSSKGTAQRVRLPVEGVLMAGKTGTAQVRRISLAERHSTGVLSNESLAWRMRDHSLFVGFAPADNPRYAAACVVEHGGWGASVAAPAIRDTLTYLFDKPKAMASLAALEEQWGGTLEERIKRRSDAWLAANAKAKPAATPPSPSAATAENVTKPSRDAAAIPAAAAPKATAAKPASKPPHGFE
jgi:penicillin-binding protein 2